MRFELPWYDVNYRDGRDYNTPAGEKIEELNKFLRENWVKWWIACLDGKWQVVQRYTDRVVLEIDDSVSPEKLEKIKKMVSELLKIMWTTESQLVDNFEDKEVDETVLKLIEEGKWEFVARHLDEFRVNHNEIVSKLVDVGKWGTVIKYRNNFKWVDKSKFIEKLLKRLDWAYILVKSRYLVNNNGFISRIKQNYIDFFDWVVLNQDIAEKLIDFWKNVDYPIPIPNLLFDNNYNCLQYFEWLDYKKLEKKLIESWYWRYVIDHPEYFWTGKEDN